MRIDVDVHMRGPIFDGRAARAAHDFVRTAEEEIATRLGVHVVRGELDRVLKHPTGHYRSKIAAGRRGGSFVVHDNDVVYGPWLSGKGSRNAPVTSFGGYDHWERATEKINQRAPRVAGSLLRQRFLRRMGG